MKSNVTYEKKMRDKAIAEKKKLITIDYDGRAIKAGRVTLQCYESPAIVKAVAKAMAVILEESAKNNA